MPGCRARPSLSPLLGELDAVGHERGLPRAGEGAGGYRRALRPGNPSRVPARVVGTGSHFRPKAPNYLSELEKRVIQRAARNGAGVRYSGCDCILARIAARRTPHTSGRKHTVSCVLANTLERHKCLKHDISTGGFFRHSASDSVQECALFCLRLQLVGATSGRTRGACGAVTGGRSETFARNSQILPLTPSIRLLPGHQW